MKLSCMFILTVQPYILYISQNSESQSRGRRPVVKMLLPGASGESGQMGQAKNLLKAGHVAGLVEASF